MPRASSRAELANRTEPVLSTTATSVASRSSDWKRPGPAAVSASLLFADAGAREFPLEAGNVVLIARDARLELGDAFHVLLVVLVLGAEHLRLATVVFLEQLGLPRFRFLQLGFQDGLGFGVPLALFAGIHALAGGRRLRRGSDLRRRRTVDPRALDDRDVAAVQGLAALG